MLRFALAVFALSGVLLSIPLFGQNATLPTVILSCEEGAACVTWTFHGDLGEGRWSQGSVAELRIRRFGKDIWISRIDNTGATLGMMADYTGPVKGNKIEGHQTWHWSGHGRAGDGVRKWHATIQSFTSNTPTPPPNNSDQPVKAPVAVEQPKPKSEPVVLSAECGVAADAKAKYQEGRRLYYRHEYGSAWPCLQQAASLAPAMALIGEFYDYNYVGNGDPKLAVEWYTKAAGLGDTDGMEGLGHMYMSARGVSADAAQGISWYTKAVNAGDVNAMRIMGDIYYLGMAKTPKDMAAARNWYERAAAKGDGHAKHTLAHFGLPIWNLNGIWAGYLLTAVQPDVIKVDQVGNKVTAIRLTLDFKPTGLDFMNGVLGDQSAKGNIAMQMAKYNMVNVILFGSQDENTGNMKPSGFSTVKITMLDPDRFTVDGHGPFERFSSPEPDDLWCMPSNYLAVMDTYAYKRGELAMVRKDYEQARCWYTIAAAEKEPRAATSMGLLQMRGIGVKDSEKTILEWLKQGADGGDYHAAELLSSMYADGKFGVSPDKQEAERWKEEGARLLANRQAKAAEERRKDKEYAARLHAFETALSATQEVLKGVFTRSPQCDIYCSKDEMYTGSCSIRMRHREEAIDRGEINCD